MTVIIRSGAPISGDIARSMARPPSQIGIHGPSGPVDHWPPTQLYPTEGSDQPSQNGLSLAGSHGHPSAGLSQLRVHPNTERVPRIAVRRKLLLLMSTSGQYTGTPDNYRVLRVLQQRPFKLWLAERFEHRALYLSPSSDDPRRPRRSTQLEGHPAETLDQISIVSARVTVGPANGIDNDLLLVKLYGEDPGVPGRSLERMQYLVRRATSAASGKGEASHAASRGMQPSRSQGVRRLPVQADRPMAGTRSGKPP